MEAYGAAEDRACGAEIRRPIMDASTNKTEKVYPPSKLDLVINELHEKVKAEEGKKVIFDGSVCDFSFLRNVLLELRRYRKEKARDRKELDDSRFRMQTAENELFNYKSVEGKYDIIKALCSELSQVTDMLKNLGDQIEDYETKRNRLVKAIAFAVSPDFATGCDIPRVIKEILSLSEDDNDAENYSDDEEDFNGIW